MTFIVVIFTVFYFRWKEGDNDPPPFKPPGEVTFDPSIKTPKQKIYLIQFQQLPGLGNPCCRKMWYAFRYVNADGRYGKLGPWSDIPVYSGAKDQPCIPMTPKCSGKCTNQYGNVVECVPLGEESCLMNLPRIGVLEELDYRINDGKHYAVIHRQFDSLDLESEGEAIGILTKGSPYSGVTYWWDDYMSSSQNSDSYCDVC